MDEQTKFLSDRLLSEELPVTYRLLSRALNIHVNQAKGALHEFHKYQNGQCADSVFATYMVSGTKVSPDEEGDEETFTRTITLVAEVKLQDVLSEYQQVDSIHVYSLSPHPARDLTLLSDVAKSVQQYVGKDEGNNDEQAKKYGTILNPAVRRRERKGMPMSMVMSPPKPTPAAAKPAKEEPKRETPPEGESTPPSSGAGKKPAVQSKRGPAGGGIMSSFAKAVAKPPKPQPKPAKKQDDPEEDTAMRLSDDGEADDCDLPPTKTTRNKKSPSTDTEAQAKSRRDREAELRRMMEEYEKEDTREGEDEEEEVDEKQEDEEMEEPEPEPEPEPQPVKEEEKPAEITATSGDGRRRGKRRVTKKKRILDDQGYMVTIQEEGWESFSEEEAPPPASKPASAASSASAPKAKKPPTKSGGQGSIMSFFTKK